MPCACVWEGVRERGWGAVTDALVLISVLLAVVQGSSGAMMCLLHHLLLELPQHFTASRSSPGNNKAVILILWRLSCIF